MAHQDQNQQSKPFQFPLDCNSYKILNEIGVGVSAIVYKALCIPLNSTVVAIKSIDLDQSRADFDNIRLEIKTMNLLSHPNILKAHCSFTVGRRLWVVMPFMSAGSFQSIIASSFPEGLSEPCIAVVLRETLNALSYLHGQGHLHRDIKAGNILMDSNGRVKLADFGVSASVYESNTTTGSGGGGASLSHSSSRLMLTDVAGTPYWMAPEVIHSHNGYSFKADIWSFGITALELAHGCPPLSHLPLSKSLIMKITKRFRFSDYEKHKKEKGKKFSKAFKDMVASCLDQDPSKRPSAEKLLKHPFFKNCKSVDLLVKNVLQGLPCVEERFKQGKLLNNNPEEEDDDHVEGEDHEIKKIRRISGWNFNEEGFNLDPVFPPELRGDPIVKQVQFGGETIIKSPIGSAESSPGGSSIGEEGLKMVKVGDQEVIDNETMLEGLMVLKKSLDEQREKVINLIEKLGGGGPKMEGLELVKVVENLNEELENEKQKNLHLDMELEFLKLLISGSYSSSGTTD